MRGGQIAMHLKWEMDVMKGCEQGKQWLHMNHWLKLRMVRTKNNNRFQCGCDMMVWSENQDLQTHNQRAVCYDEKATPMRLDVTFFALEGVSVKRLDPL